MNGKNEFNKIHRKNCKILGNKILQERNTFKKQLFKHSFYLSFKTLKKE